jgi:glutathione S-transferase
MAIIENPKSPLIAKLEGVHLWHFEGAPCAQRVRFALVERGLRRGREVPWYSDKPEHCRGEAGRWVSRHVSLIKKDHITPEYAAIQPNMVVPALVHDGVLHIESMDIVQYVDDHWPGEKLIPADPERLNLNEDLVTQAKALHRSVRFVSFRWGLRSLGKLNAKEEAQLKQLEQQDSPEKMAEFYSGFDSGTIPQAVYLDHLRRLEAGYARIDGLLDGDGRRFLTGATLTPADIIWSLSVLRLSECGYPFAEHYPALADWYGRIAQRPGFREGVMARNRFLSGAFKAKAAVENLFGKGLRQASQLPVSA